MSRKFKIIVAALVAVVALSIGVGGVAFASDPDATAEQLGANMAQHNAVDTVADLIGLSPEEIMELRQDGMSLAEIAAAQGVDEQTLTDALVAAATDRVQQKVDEGVITQEQADEILAQITDRMSDVVNRTEVGRPEFAGQGICGGQGSGDGTGQMNRWQHQAQKMSKGAGSAMGAGRGSASQNQWNNCAN